MNVATFTFLVALGFWQTASAATALYIPPPPHQLRIIWVGSPEAQEYELHTASDEKFTKLVKKLRIKELGQVIPELKALPKFAKIRGLRMNQPVTGFTSLYTRPTQAPKLPKLVETTENQVSKTWVEWEAPKDSHPDHQLMYRVRIFNASGAILLDSLLRQNRVRPPSLPQGAYEIQVEALGDEMIGQIHIEGMGAAATVLIVKP